MTEVNHTYTTHISYVFLVSYMTRHRKAEQGFPYFLLLPFFFFTKLNPFYFYSISISLCFEASM